MRERRHTILPLYKLWTRLKFLKSLCLSALIDRIGIWNEIMLKNANFEFRTLIPVLALPLISSLILVFCFPTLLRCLRCVESGISSPQLLKTGYEEQCQIFQGTSLRCHFMHPTADLQKSQLVVGRAQRQWFFNKMSQVILLCGYYSTTWLFYTGRVPGAFLMIKYRVWSMGSLH